MWCGDTISFYFRCDSHSPRTLTHLSNLICLWHTSVQSAILRDSISLLHRSIRKLGTPTPEHPYRSLILIAVFLFALNYLCRCSDPPWRSLPQHLHTCARARTKTYKQMHCRENNAWNNPTLKLKYCKLVPLWCAFSIFCKYKAIRRFPFFFKINFYQKNVFCEYPKICWRIRIIERHNGTI